MVRRVVKAFLAGALHASDAVRARRSYRRRAPLFMAYHRVVPEFEPAAASNLPAMLISLSTLERQLDWIGLRYTFVSLDDLDGRLLREGRGGKPVAAVTFDDGYRDTYVHALPLLERKGIPGAVFPVTELVGTHRPQRHDALYLALDRALAAWGHRGAQLERAVTRHGATPELAGTLSRTMRTARYATPLILDAMTAAQVDALIESLTAEFGDGARGRDDLLALDWPMLAAMIRRGMVVGSHTVTHPVLTNETLTTVRREVWSSRVELERQLGIAIRHFAYPGGHFDADVVEAVAAAGYRFAYTTCFHSDAEHPELTLSRRVFWERTAQGAWSRFSPSMMRCQVRGVFDFGGACRHTRVHEFAAAGAAGARRAAGGVE